MQNIRQTEPQTSQLPIEDILKRVPEGMLQAIKDWEAIEERESRGWDRGGVSPKEPKVKGSDILKAEAILKAQARMREETKQESKWIQPDLFENFPKNKNLK